MSMSSIRLALRLAFRDARRSKGRSTLVLVLLSLPVTAVVAGAALVDGFTLSDQEEAERELGGADATVAWEQNEPIEHEPSGMHWRWGQLAQDPIDEEVTEPFEPTTAEVEAELPEGSRVVEVTQGQSATQTPHGPRMLDLEGIDLADPLAADLRPVQDGAVPAAGELALSTAAAEHLDIQVGEAIELEELDEELVVSGVVEDPGALDRQFAVTVPEAFDGEIDRWLVETPQPVTWEEVQELNEIGMAVLSRAVAADPPPSPIHVEEGPADVAFAGLMVLFAAMTVLQIVLLAGPAFSIGAKRRVREFALLAVNGASPAQIRRTVLAGGAILGALATLLSVAAGFALAAAATPLAEGVFSARSTGFGLLPHITLPAAALALCTGVLAALVPAAIAARQDVVAGLHGRRGATRVKKRWVLLGAGLATAGTGLGVHGILNSYFTQVAGAVVLVQIGLVLCTPALVAAISKLGKILPLTPRMALRDAGRNRAAAAPAVSAIMAVVAAGLAITMFSTADSERNHQMSSGAPPEGTVVANLSVHNEEAEHGWHEALDEDRLELRDDAIDQLSQLAEDHLPVRQAHVLPQLGCTPEHDGDCEPHVKTPESKQCPYEADVGPHMVADMTEVDIDAAADHPHCDAEVSRPGPAAVSRGAYLVDAAAVEALSGASESDLAAAKETLDAGGVVISQESMIEDGEAVIEHIELFSDDEESMEEDSRESAALPAHALTTGNLAADVVLLSPQAAAEAELHESTGTTVLFPTSTMPTESDEAIFDDVVRGAGLGPAWASTGAQSGPVEVSTQVARDTDTVLSVILLILGVVSALLALGAAAVATALAAAESRRDLSMLAAVGASPATRRKLSLCQAGTISILGTGIGVAAGLGACTAAIAAFNVQVADAYPAEPLYPLSVPWLYIALVLIAVPATAMLGAGLLTRSRLPSERRAE